MASNLAMNSVLIFVFLIFSRFLSRKLLCLWAIMYFLSDHSSINRMEINCTLRWLSSTLSFLSTNSKTSKARDQCLPGMKSRGKVDTLHLLDNKYSWEEQELYHQFYVSKEEWKLSYFLLIPFTASFLTTSTWKVCDLCVSSLYWIRSFLKEDRKSFCKIELKEQCKIFYLLKKTKETWIPMHACTPSWDDESQVVASNVSSFASYSFNVILLALF